MVHGVPPFPYVRESLELMTQHADAIVVSQTPVEALVREWQEHNIDGYVKVIAGQEMGTKTEHIRYGLAGAYAPDHKLMIGDAPGDLKAARDNNASFSPSTRARRRELGAVLHRGFQRFLEGTYGGEYEAALIAEFEQGAARPLPPGRGSKHGHRQRVHRPLSERRRGARHLRRWGGAARPDGKRVLVIIPDSTRSGRSRSASGPDCELQGSAWPSSIS
jgi:hypothetical protein